MMYGLSTKAVYEAVEREKCIVAIGRIVNSDESLKAQAAANQFSVLGLKAYIKMICCGHHWESSAAIVSRCPDDLLDMAVYSIQRKHCMGITDGW